MKKFLAILFGLCLGFGLFNIFVELDAHKKMLHTLAGNQLELAGTLHMDYPSRVQAVAAKCARATFRVGIAGANGGYGSCVLLDKGQGIFLSAAHVIANDPNFLEYQNTRIPIVHSVYEPNSFDVGLIFVNPCNIVCLDCISLPLAEYNVVSGTPCLLSGFPGMLEGLQTITPSTVLAKTKTFNQPMYRVVGNFHEGMSGGPMVDLEGRIVGIICHSIGRESPFTGFICFGYGGVVPSIDARTLIDDLQGITNGTRQAVQ